MSNSKEILRIIFTKRNKGLEPLPTGVGVIGYDPEIHDEDSVTFTYNLPLGAIKRLVKSYYEEIRSIDEQSVYLATTGSTEIRMKPYSYRMLGEIKDQLDKHGLNGRKIIDEVFDRYFKADYEKMKRFSKNHGVDVMESFKPCNDPKCCNYSSSIFLNLKLFRKLFKEFLQGVKIILHNRIWSVGTDVEVRFMERPTLR